MELSNIMTTQGSQSAGTPREFTPSPAVSQPQNNAIPTSASDAPAFESYAAYLKSIRQEWPEYEDLVLYLNSNSPSWGDRASVMTAEVENNKISCKSFGLPEDTDRALDSIYSSSKGRSMTIQTQIIFIGCIEGANVQKIIDAVGLHYDVDPAFFMTFVLGEYLHNQKAHPRPGASRRFFSFPERMAAQILRGQNAAGKQYAVGEL